MEYTTKNPCLNLEALSEGVFPYRIVCALYKIAQTRYIFPTGLDLFSDLFGSLRI